MKKTVWLVIALVMFITPMSAFAQENGAAAIRYVHALDGAPNVDIYTDGVLLYADLGLGEATPYFVAPTGTLLVAVTGAGDETPIWEQNIDVAAGQALTAIVSSDNPLEFAVFQDDLNPLPVGRARLTAIHAIPDVPPVDIVLADGRPVIPNLEYNQPYGTLDIPAQSYGLVVTPAGGALDEALLPATTFALSTGTSYIAVAYGTAENPMALLLSAPTLPNDETSAFVRVIHAAEGASEVDIAADGSVIIPALAFGTATDYLAIPAGDYEVSVTPVGLTDALVSTTLTIAPNSRTTVIASAAGDSLVLSAFTSEITLASADDAVFSLANVSSDSTASAALESGASLIDALDGDDYTSVLVTTGSDNISITAESQEVSSEAAFDATGIYGGVYYDAVVYPGETAPQMLTLPIVSLPLSIASSASASAIEPALAPTEAVAASTTDPNIALPTATQAAQVQPPVAQTTATGPTARIVLNPGANLQLRQYPSAEALSLGLAPSGTVLQVLGRDGAEVPPDFFTPTPTPQGAATPTPFIDPVTLLGEDEDLDPFETWLYVIYSTPDGGQITAWVNALYIELRDERGLRLALRDLPTVPRNRFGEQRGAAAGIAPTANPLRNVNVAIVQGLQEGANLHLRRRPNSQSESLALIPNGTQMIVSGRTVAGDWLEVEYEGQIGWVSVPFVRVTYNDDAVDVTTIEILATPTVTPTATLGA